MNRKIFLVLVLGLFLFGGVFAEKDQELEVVDYSDDLSIKDFRVRGAGVVMNDTDSSFSFSENGVLNINGSIFGNIEEGGKIDIDSSGQIESANFVTTEGTIYSINGVEFEAPEGATVTYSKEGGVVINAKKNSKFFKNPKFSDYENGFKIIGENVTLPLGYVLNSGELNYDSRGNAFIVAGKRAEINGVEVKAAGNTNVFFDGKSKELNEYVSFGDKTFFASSTSGAVIYFEKGNPYAKIEEGDKLKVFFIDGSIELKNRDEEGLIPEMKIAGSDISVNQDSKILKLEQGELFIDRWIHGSTSPMVMSFFTEENEPIFDFDKSGISSGDSDNGRILVDNFNRFSVIPEGDSEDFKLKNQGVDTKFSQRISYNYLSKEEMLKIADGKIEMRSSKEGYSSLFYGRVRDYWKEIPENVRESVDKVIFYDNKDSFSDKEVSAFYMPGADGDSMSFYASEHSYSQSVFRHEISHAYLDMYDTPKDKESIALRKNVEKEIEGYFGASRKELDLKEVSLIKKKIELERKVNSKQDMIDLSMEAISESKNERAAKNLKSQLNSFTNDKKKFQKELELVQVDYDIAVDKVDRFNLALNQKYLLEKKNAGLDYFNEWKGEYTDTYVDAAWKSEDASEYPKEGFIRPYGRMDKDEDHSTYSEWVKTPEKFASLINPGGKKYHPDYRMKIDTMYNIGSISKEEYQAILEAAGVK